MISVHSSDKEAERDERLDTLVYPLVQMGYYGISQDEKVTERALSDTERTDQLYLASGYFNLPPQYTSAIFRGQGMCHILAASPQVYRSIVLQV